MPQVQAVLSPENITQIQEIGRWGKGNIIEAVYSPDRTQLVVGTALGVYVYESETAEQLSFIPVENMQLVSMAVSPDGQWVAMGIAPDQIELRSLQDGSLRHKFLAPESNQTLEFTADGTLLLADNAAWQVSDGASISSLFDLDYLSANGKTAASAVRNGVEISELLIGNEISVSPTGIVIPDTLPNLTNVALSANGEFLALGGWGDVVEIYEVSDGTLQCSLNFAPSNTFLSRQRLASPSRNNSPGPHRVTDLQFTPDSEALAVVSGFEELTLWQTDDCDLLRRVPDVYGEIVFSADGARLAAWQGTLTQWDMETGKRLNQLQQHADWITDLAFTPTGSHLAIASNFIYLRNMIDGGLLTSLPGSASNVAITPDGQTLLSTDDQDLSIWNLEDSSHFSVKASEGSWPIQDLALSPDGKVAATVSHDDAVRVWSVDDGHMLREGYSMFGQRIAFSPTEPIFAFLGHDWDEIELWSLPSLDGTDSGQLEYGLRRDTTNSSIALRSLAFTGDGNLLAAGLDDGRILIWHIGEELPIQELVSDTTDYVEDVVFSPDGQLLASVSYDQTFKIWRVGDGVLLHSLTLPSDPHSLAISPDGRILAIGSTDGTVRLWGIP